MKAHVLWQRCLICALICSVVPAYGQSSGGPEIGSSSFGLGSSDSRVIQRYLDEIATPAKLDFRLHNYERNLPLVLGDVVSLPERFAGFNFTPDERKFRTVSPTAAAIGLANTVNSYNRSCLTDKPKCKEAQYLDNTVGLLRLAALANPRCDAAANEYGVALSYEIEPSDNVARAFDAACLGSFVTRRTNGSDISSESIPQIFRSDSVGKSALSAVGILSVNSRIFCHGLLRTNRTLITAKHCFDDEKGAFQRGIVTVRSADGNGVWTVSLAQVVSGPEGSNHVKSDWAVFKLTGTGPMNVIEVDLVGLETPAPLTLVSSYSGHALLNYPNSLEPIRQSLRFPRANMCHGIKNSNGCLVISCQTVPGFSGTPLFLTSSSSVSGRPTVVGFVSRGKPQESNCEQLGVDSTFAVSAEQIPS